MNIAYFVNECIELKTKYLPDDKIEFLIIGESPPVSGNYFYKPINLKRGSARIPAQVFRIFFNLDGVSNEEYKKCLNELKIKYHLYLDDLSEFPVNDYTASERVNVICSSLDNLNDRIKKLNFSDSCQKVLVLPKRTLDKFQDKKYYAEFTRILEILDITQSQICIFSRLGNYLRNNWEIFNESK
jgi:hypothetical protein